MSEIQKLIPVLVCQDIAGEHDFLVGILGFSSGGIHRTSEERAVHGEVRADGLVIWLHRVADELKLASPRSMLAASSGLFVYVADVDAHYARVRSRGARPDSEPKDMPYGQREYGVTDPEGHRWWFATPLK
jgi:MerR family transcriptional regulator, thiopeptide resistance regulator